MYSFDWDDENGVFSAYVSEGRAIIEEHRLRGYGVPIGGGWKYDARIELSDGRIYRAFRDFSTFEDAESWCHVVLPEFYRAQKKKHEPDPLESALVICQQHLPPSLPRVYHQRLEALRRWVKNPTLPEVEEYREVPAPQLKWSDEEPRWIAETGHGQAHIWQEPTPQKSRTFRKRANPIYHAKIRHPSEAELRCEETFANWEEAEEWVQEMLYQLEQPYVTEYLLGVLIFSIEVYQCVLDSKIEQKMVVLLEELKTELSLVLP